jgi:F-type H+-transporting ATPase subunit b
MLIDWFTVAAQIINFLILVGLLKYFLYDRVIKAIDQRENTISSRLEDASKQRKAAERDAQTYRVRTQEIEDRQSELFARAKAKADEQKRKWVQQARDDVDNLQAKWYQGILRRKEAFLQDLKQRAGSEVYSITRRTLTDLADAGLERRMVDVFLQRITKLEKEKREEIARAVRQEGLKIQVNSAFDLPADERKKLTETIREVILKDAEIAYHTIPEMILGIEMKTRGYKVAWSVEEYLQLLEQRVAKTLEAGAEGK